MARYQPDASLTPEIVAELLRLADLLRNVDTETLSLAPLVHEPAKYDDGMLVYWTGDTTTWNPGSGEGVYCYYNSTWNYLG